MGLMRRPTLAPPQQAGQINWAHPLAKGLSFVWFAGTSDREWTRGVAPSTRNATRSVGAKGPAAHCSTGQVNIEWPTQFTATSDGAGTGDFTMLSVGNPVASASSVNHMLAQKNDAAGTPFAQAALLANSRLAVVSSGDFELFTYNNGNNSTITATGVVDGNWHAFAGVRSGTTHSIFVDGRLNNSSTLTAQNISQAGRYTAVGSRGNGTTESFVNDISCALMWNRALTNAEIQSISANPYQILMPAQAIAVNTLAGSASLAALLNGVSSLTTALSLSKPLAAAPAAVASVTPGLALSVPLAAAPSAVSTVTPGLALSVPLAASPAAVSTITSAVSLGKPLASSLAGVSTVTPALSLSIPLGTALGSVSTITAALAGGNLAANLNAVSSITASITLSKPLAGSISALSVITGDLASGNAGWSIVAPVVGFWHAEDFILTEDGGYFLLEDGSRLMLDTPPGDPWTKSTSTAGVWH